MLREGGLNAKPTRESLRVVKWEYKTIEQAGIGHGDLLEIVEPLR